jgi:hypothetical protein
MPDSSPNTKIAMATAATARQVSHASLNAIANSASIGRPRPAGAAPAGRRAPTSSSATTPEHRQHGHAVGRRRQDALHPDQLLAQMLTSSPINAVSDHDRLRRCRVPARATSALHALASLPCARVTVVTFTFPDTARSDSKHQRQVEVPHPPSRRLPEGMTAYVLRHKL